MKAKLSAVVGAVPGTERLPVNSHHDLPTGPPAVQDSPEHPPPPPAPGGLQGTRDNGSD